VLTAAALALGMAVATATLSVALDVGDRLAREFRSLGANLLVNRRDLMGDFVNTHTLNPDGWVTAVAVIILTLVLVYVTILHPSGMPGTSGYKPAHIQSLWVAASAATFKGQKNLGFSPRVLSMHVSLPGLFGWLL